MSAERKSRHDDGRAAGRPARSHNLAGGVFATVCLAAAFLGLVVLPETRANIWWPSSAGDSSFLVGP